ncbi:MAG TPA: T9SS type A sorting domain-containing protein, partial [Chitinophagaceae bacterium]|nr:T9SS type A sorting domain-containing protein [Chitinophagaceae bacterium]
RADDYGGTFALATTTPFSNNQFNINGIVEKNPDQDMFKFTMSSAAEFTLDAIPYNVGTGDAGSDLDLQISLYNNSQTLLNVYNPGTLLSSVIDTVLNSGTYYIKVEGKGNIYAPNYASLGSYSLQGAMKINTTLPLRKLELHGSTNSDKHQLNWLIDADEQVIKQIVEVSTDGITFSPLTQPENIARSYAYTPLVSGTLLYRLNVTFDNGRQYYSNIVTLKQFDITPRPQLKGNLVTTGNIIVSSPGNFNYTIFDFNGKVTNKGQLTNGTNNIHASAMIPGMYMIRFDNGRQQWTDKLVRQ